MTPAQLAGQLVVTVGEYVRFDEQFVAELALGWKAPAINAGSDILDDRSGAALRTIGRCGRLVRQRSVRTHQGVESREELSRGLERG